jgi:hypothetical protein
MSSQVLEPARAAAGWSRSFRQLSDQARADRLGVTADVFLKLRDSFGGEGLGPLKPKPKPATRGTQFLNEDEAAAELHKTKRWLREWLRRHPQDATGEPYFTPVGRNKIFHQNDIRRIEQALRDEARCPSNSDRRGKVKRPTSKSEAHISDAELRLAAELTGDPSLVDSFAGSKSASSNTASTRLPRPRRAPVNRRF